METTAQQVGNMETSKVISLIRTLIQRTESRGCTEAEAIQAAEKVGTLLENYNLSMDQIFLASAKYVEKKISTGRERKLPIDNCMIAMAQFCDCKVWCSHYYDKDEFGKTLWDTRQAAYCFFGMETDVEMVEYLYKVVLSAMLQETEAYKFSTDYCEVENDGYDSRTAAGRRRAMTVSFQKGMASRIHHRLTKMTEERHKKESEATRNARVENVIVNGTASTNGEQSFSDSFGHKPIMDSNGCTDIVLIKKNKLQDEFEKLGMKLGKCSRGVGASNYNAYRSGQDAGNRVNLSRPLAGGSVAGYLK